MKVTKLELDKPYNPRDDKSTLAVSATFEFITELEATLFMSRLVALVMDHQGKGVGVDDATH
jgi:hypothetical protein